MPANPPAIHTPPSAAPTVPGGVHAMPSASPAAPGAVHVAPVVGGGGGIFINNTGEGDANGVVIPAGSVSGKPAWTTNGQSPLDLLGVSQFVGLWHSAGAWRVINHYPGYPNFYEAYSISEADSPLGLVYQLTIDSPGSPPTLAETGGSLPTPPPIHAAPTPAPAAPPVITP